MRALVVLCGIVGFTVAASACGEDVTTGGNGGSSNGSATTGDAECKPACGVGLTCCGGACVNVLNDIGNCGACAVLCTGPSPFCAGTCQQAPCDGDAGACTNGTCCGSACCNAGELCCQVNMGGPSQGPTCYPPENGTCPIGCPDCL